MEIQLEGYKRIITCTSVTPEEAKALESFFSHFIPGQVFRCIWVRVKSQSLPVLTVKHSSKAALLLQVEIIVSNLENLISLLERGEGLKIMEFKLDADTFCITFKA